MPRLRRRSIHKQSHTTPHLDTLYHLGQALSGLFSVAEMSQIFARDLRNTCGLHNLVLAVYSETNRTLRFEFVSVGGSMQSWPTVPIDQHVFGHVVQSRQAQVMEQPQSCSWLVLPLIYVGSVVGLLAVGPAERALWHRRLLQTCAELFSTAFYLVEHIEALELTFAEQASTLAGINEIARQLNATLDVQQIVDLMLLHALGTTGLQAGAVLMVVGDDQLQLQAQRLVDQSVIADLQGGMLSVAQFAAIDLHQEYHLWPIERLPQILRLQAIASHVVIVPLCREGRLLGLLLLAVEAEQRLDPIQVRFLQQLAAHAALAISNAEAYSKIAQQNDLLDRHLTQIQAVSRVSQAISAHLDLKELLPEIVALVRSALGYRTALLSLADVDDSHKLRWVAAQGLPDQPWQVLRHQVVPLTAYHQVMNDLFTVSRSFYVPHNHVDEETAQALELTLRGYCADLGKRPPHEWQSGDMLLIPLYGHQGSLVGILSVDDPADRQRPTPQTITILEIFAIQAATAISNAQMYAEMERQALTDSLTGLPNQRYFVMHLRQQMAAAERYQQPFALLALDIDYFKSYNDSFGHLAGNVVLREFAKLLCQTMRTSDFVARWGGEEFFVLLPNSSLEGALDVAERIRQTVRSHIFPNRSITVSIGAVALEPGMLEQDVLNAADVALYRAKVMRDSVAT